MKVSRLLTLPFFLLLIAVLPGCLSLQSDEQKEEEAEKSVLAKHDELMAQMDQLYTLRQQLQKAPVSYMAVVSQRRRSLLAADAAMMGWMHQYRKPADTVAHESKMKYFEAQRTKIDSVARVMRGSIDSAQLVLKQVETTAKPSAQ
ncbi:hypothetical protein [Hymenobacter jejuensis]|uniref:Viral A-type inclusion protein n=1 Tax=Hymenobacter jejuensis TaxID=2502781 RepID=A0A5B8A310_9BACT|nr:hypothetical protein [Hymenobacter jejuensis]QDA61698.1 hypothetical protein FHG12_17050 [Hymenobacter jejuensis]